MGSPPPLGRPSTERPLCVGISPQIPPLSSLLLSGELVAASLGGQRLRSVPPCMVIFSLSVKGWFHFLVLWLSKKIVKLTIWWKDFWHNSTICSNFPTNFSPTFTFSFSASLSLSQPFPFCWHFCPLWVWQVFNLANCVSCLFFTFLSLFLSFYFYSLFFSFILLIFFFFFFFISLSFYHHYHLSLHLSHLCFCELLSISCGTCVSIFIGLWLILCIFWYLLYMYFDILWWRLSICYLHVV